MADTATLIDATARAGTVSFHVNGFDIVTALNALRPMIRRHTIPILTMVRLTGSAEALRFEATDLDAVFTYDLPGGYPAFDVLVDYTTLAGFARVLHGSLFRVEAGPDVFRIHDFLFATPEGVTFQTMPAGDWPAFRELPLGEAFDFDPAMLARVRSAISTEETRYYLNGVYVHAAEDGLRLAATDGHRMNVLRTGLAYTGPNAILPRNIAVWIAAQKAKGQLALCTEGARWTSGNLTVIAKCIDGKFPDYTRVMPKDIRLTATIRRKALLNLIASLRAFNTSKSFALKFGFLGDELTISVSYETNSGGRMDRVALKLDDIEFSGRLNAEAFEVGFNGHYVAAALNCVASDTVTIQFTDHCSPSLIEDDGLSLVLMPLRV